MQIRIETSKATPGMPAILIDGHEAGRLASAGAKLKTRMTRWRAYDGEVFDDIAGAQAFFEREFADTENIQPAPRDERTEIAVARATAVAGAPAEWIVTADGVELGRLVPDRETGQLKARMSRWKAYEGTTFADPDAARRYFDTEFNGRTTEAPTR